MNTQIFFIVFYAALFLLLLYILGRITFWVLKKRKKDSFDSSSSKKIQTEEKDKKEKDAQQEEEGDIEGEVLEISHISEEEKAPHHRKVSPHSKDIVTLLKRAEVFIARKEYPEAKKSLIKILAWDEDHAEASTHLGFVYLQTKEYKKAESLFRKALEVRSQDASLLTNFSLSLFEQKDPSLIEESLEALKKAAQLDGKNPERFANLGQSLFFIGEKEEALTAFEKAVKIAPRNLDYLFFLADSYLALEREAEAKKIFQKITDIAPFNKDALRELEQLKDV